MENTADVVIIGGGIQGCSALYHLVEAGIENVVLVEMDEVGGRCSTTAYTGGWVMLQEPLELNIQLSIMSYPEFALLQEKFGADISFQKKGSLSINTVEHVEEMLKRAELQRSLGVPTEIWTAEEIYRIAPFLNVDDIGIGLFCGEDGALDTHSLLQTYIKEARNLGAYVYQGVKATNIKTSKGKVSGVETTQGFISTPIVVNAAGIYAKLVGQWVGVGLPLNNALRHTMLTESTPLIRSGMPMIEILEPEEMYIEGRLEVKSGLCHADYSVGMDTTDSFEHRHDLAKLVFDYGDAIAHRMPAILDLGIINCFAGIRTATPDGLPILGFVDGIEGYINDCGWAGSGISHAPAGGQLITGCVLGKADLPVNIKSFSLNRFRTGVAPFQWTHS